MIFSILSLLLLEGCASKKPAIPKASYNLQLDEYTLRLQDFTFPSGLRVLHIAETTYSFGIVKFTVTKTTRALSIHAWHD